MCLYACNVMQCNAIQCNAMSCHVMSCNVVVWCDVVWYGIVWYGMYVCVHIYIYICGGLVWIIPCGHHTWFEC